MSDLSFTKILKEDFPLIEQYTPVLVRVHGESHPELAQVLEVFVKLNSKVKGDVDLGQIDLAPEFNELRKITGDYAIPVDACETYIATYQMLETAEKAYHKEKD